MYRSCISMCWHSVEFFSVIICLVHRVMDADVSVLQQAGFPSCLHVLLTSLMILIQRLMHRHSQKVLACILTLPAEVLATWFVYTADSLTSRGLSHWTIQTLAESIPLSAIARSFLLLVTRLLSSIHSTYTCTYILTYIFSYTCVPTCVQMFGQCIASNTCAYCVYFHHIYLSLIHIWRCRRRG